MLKASKRFRSRLPQNGDTIVEVLICLAVVGFSLTLSYSLSRASLRKVRDAEERQQSTQMAQTQIERLKGFLAANPTIKTSGTSGLPWLLNPAGALPAVIQVGTAVTDAPPGFCLYSGLSIRLTINPRDPYCAASWTGEMYCDKYPASCTTAPTDATVDDAGYRFRVGIVYPAINSKLPTLGPEFSPLKNDEFYSAAGTYQVGGDGTNFRKYSAVGIPFRIHQ